MLITYPLFLRMEFVSAPYLVEAPLRFIGLSTGLHFDVSIGVILMVLVKYLL